MTQQRWIPGRRTRIALWLAISGLCTTVAVLQWLQSPQQRTMRYAADVLANVVPGFGLYVDERSCAECHPTQAASHPQTGHARTLRHTAEWRLAATLNGMAFQDPERGVKYHYHFDPQQGLSVTLPERLGNDSFPLTYAFGSGRGKVTFLTLIPSRVGGAVGIEHRVSIRGDQNGLGLELTPGHQGHVPAQEVEQFGRVIDAVTLERCLDCHATRGEIREPEIQGLESNVGCQKCHGPGREHVIAMREAKDRGVTVPKRTQPAALEQVRACSRCHLQSGSDDDLKLLPDHIHSVRVQAAELLQSRCFTQSENRLACSTCHDPHAPIASDPAQYVQRCLSCHGTPNSVACPVSPATDCVRCHMPAAAAENGRPYHDHRIRIPAQTSPNKTPSPKSQVVDSVVPRPP
jgi:hypothetical protein